MFFSEKQCRYLNDNYIQPQRIAVMCGTVHCMMIIEELGNKNLFDWFS
jgi:hypothetical protein